MLAHVQTTGHRVCACGGYHYLHRPGSRYCELNTLSPMWRAERAGVADADLLDIALECVLSPTLRPYRGKGCPF